MKALVITLAGLLLSQASHAAGCSEAEAKRHTAEQLVRKAADEHADFYEVFVHVEKKTEGSRQYPIRSMYATYSIPMQGGQKMNGWINTEIQPRNPCFHSGSGETSSSNSRGSNDTQLNDYLRENQYGSLMRAHTPSSLNAPSSNDDSGSYAYPAPTPVPTPHPAPIANPSPAPAVPEVEDSGD